MLGYFVGEVDEIETFVGAGVLEALKPQCRCLIGMSPRKDVRLAVDKQVVNEAVYRWNMTHCATVTMLSCVSLSADNLARTPSSVYAITVYLLGDYGVNAKQAGLLER